MAKTKALQLAARFALPPNSLGFCGKDSAPEKFKQCFIHGKCAGVEEEIERFIVLHPYLKTLSKISGLDKFSYDVVEAYWLGTDLLKKSDNSHYSILLGSFTEQGVPGWLTDELKNNPPPRFIPHHLFQVLFVGVGKASQSVPFNLDSINNCMIRWGQVTKISEDSLEIDLYSLKEGSNHYQLTQNISEFSYNKDFLPKLEVGKVVAVHWEQPVKILTPKEVKNLSYWTEETINSLSLAELR